MVKITDTHGTSASHFDYLQNGEDDEFEPTPIPKRNTPSNLMDARVGDRVQITTRHGVRYGTVTRNLPTQVMVREDGEATYHRLYKRNGLPVGWSQGAGWHTPPRAELI